MITLNSPFSCITRQIVRMSIIRCALNCSYNMCGMCRRMILSCCSKCTYTAIYWTLYKLSDCFINGFIIDLLKMVKPWWHLCILPKHQNLRKAIFENLWKTCNNSVTTWIFCLNFCTIVWKYIAYNIISMNKKIRSPKL